MKADDKVTYEDNGKKTKASYTEFEYLKARVDALTQHVDLLGKLLKAHGLTKITQEYDVTPDLEDKAIDHL